MKNILTLLFAVVTFTASAQSDSFRTFKQRLDGADNMVSVSVNGFLLRTAAWLVDEDEDLKGAFSDVSGVRVINVPARELSSRNLNLKGFRKILTRDGFEEVISARDGDEHVSIFMQNGEHENLYFFLVESDNHITAVEVNGHIDPNKIIKNHSTRTLTSL